ncbi:MAG: TRAP transporter small permease subunit [Pseudomonadota bacterium]
MTTFIRTVGHLSTIAGVIAALMILVSVAVTCQMIFVRYVLNWSTVWQTEFITYLMVASTLVGLPYVQKLRGHVNVDLAPLMLRGRARHALFFTVVGLAILVIGMMLVYGIEMWWTATSRGWTSDTVWGVRLAIPYFAVPVGLGLYLLQLVADFLAVTSRNETPFGLAADEGFTTTQREGH